MYGSCVFAAADDAWGPMSMNLSDGAVEVVAYGIGPVVLASNPNGEAELLPSTEAKPSPSDPNDEPSASSQSEPEEPADAKSVGPMSPEPGVVESMTPLGESGPSLPASGAMLPPGDAGLLLSPNIE